MTCILRVLALVLLLANAAAAQSIYVAGGVGADIVLASGQESIGLVGPAGRGESLSGAARLGTVLNDRFGIELEVSRAAELRESSRPGIDPLAGLFPTFVPQIDVRSRVTTISTTASIRQQVSDNIALAYLGGVVFHRTDSRVEYGGLRAASGFSVVTGSLSSIPSRLDPISPVGLVLPFSRLETVRYGAGPVVGFEAHIGVGEHFMVIPGVRMHGLPASWLVRPGVAAGWRF